MPWHIGKSSTCPSSKPFAVIKDSDGSVAGCHPTKQKALKQQAALYANEPKAGGASMSQANPSDADQGHRPERPPRDQLVRGVFPFELREAQNSSPVMFGHFARFGEWTEIDSFWEGRFMESIAPGAFSRTIDHNRNNVKVLFNHGKDPQLGAQILGPVDELKEDSEGAYYEVSLYDGVPPLLLNGLRGGQYGASFRFRITKEEVNQKPEVSDHNPQAIPERVIKEVDLAEFGPVTFPAYEGATAGVRSLTDDYIMQLFGADPSRVAEFLANYAERKAAALLEHGPEEPHSVDGPAISPQEPLAVIRNPNRKR